MSNYYNIDNLHNESVFVGLRCSHILFLLIVRKQLYADPKPGV